MTNPNIERAISNMEAGLSLVPQHMHGAVRRYVLQGIPPGSFLTAVLANDLIGAFGRADDQNSYAMRGWAEFIVNHLPAICHGNYETVHSWKGLEAETEPSE